MTSVALVMVMLDNLVVSTALNVIREELGATIEQLEWTVNAYTLTFAVFLLTGAALGDRFGRRRMFVIGVAIFTAASAFAAMSTSVEMLLVGRMAQGVGAAIVTPLTLTLLSAAVRRGAARRGARCLGRRRAASPSPSVPSSVAPSSKACPGTGSSGSTCPSASPSCRSAGSPCARATARPAGWTCRGVALASVGLLGIVWALVNGNSEGWTSPTIVASFAIGVAFLVAFLAWERRAPAPDAAAALLPGPLLQPGQRVLDAHELRDVRLHLPAGPVPAVRALLLAAGGGAAILPWTLAPMFVAPIAGALSDRIGGGLLMGVGLTLQAIGLAWLGLVSSTTVEYATLVLPFLISGIGMGLFFAPVANVAAELGAAGGGRPGLRRRQRHPRARRRLRGGGPGGRLRPQGSFGSPQAFVDGMVPAILIGAAFVGLGAVAAFAIPRTRRVTAEQPELRWPARMRPGGG